MIQRRIGSDYIYYYEYLIRQLDVVFCGNEANVSYSNHWHRYDDSIYMHFNGAIHLSIVTRLVSRRQIHVLIECILDADVRSGLEIWKSVHAIFCTRVHCLRNVQDFMSMHYNFATELFVRLRVHCVIQEWECVDCTTISTFCNHFISFEKCKQNIIPIQISTGQLHVASH